MINEHVLLAVVADAIQENICPCGGRFAPLCNIIIVIKLLL